MMPVLQGFEIELLPLEEVSDKISRRMCCPASRA